MRELALHILDIVKNSTKAGATTVTVRVCKKLDELIIEIIDNGCGMSDEFLSSVLSPFTTTRTTRKVGLGLPLLKDACELTGGSLALSSIVGQGTKVLAVFGFSSIDRMPLGDLGSVMTILIQGDENVRFVLTVQDEFTMDTEEIKLQMGGVPIAEMEVLEFIRDYINENIISIYGGVI